MELRDLAPVANHDAEALELANQVVGHRLAEVRTAVQERDECAASGEPDRGLAGRVSASDDADTRAPAELGLGRSRRVEDRQSLELGETLDRKSPVLGARGQQNGARHDLPVVLEADEMPAVARL